MSGLGRDLISGNCGGINPLMQIASQVNANTTQMNDIKAFSNIQQPMGMNMNMSMSHEMLQTKQQEQVHFGQQAHMPGAPLMAPPPMQMQHMHVPPPMMQQPLMKPFHQQQQHAHPHAHTDDMVNQFLHMSVEQKEFENAFKQPLHMAPPIMQQTPIHSAPHHAWANEYEQAHMRRVQAGMYHVPLYIYFTLYILYCF